MGKEVRRRITSLVLAATLAGCSSEKVEAGRSSASPTGKPDSSPTVALSPLQDTSPSQTPFPKPSVTMQPRRGIVGQWFYVDTIKPGEICAKGKKVAGDSQAAGLPEAQWNNAVVVGVSTKEINRNKQFLEQGIIFTQRANIHAYSLGEPSTFVPIPDENSKFSFAGKRIGTEDSCIAAYRRNESFGIILVQSTIFETTATNQVFATVPLFQADP